MNTGQSGSVLARPPTLISYHATAFFYWFRSKFFSKIAWSTSTSFSFSFSGFTLNCFQFYMVEQISILFFKIEQFALPWPNSQFMISKVMLDRFTSWMAQSNNHFYPIEEAEGQPAQRNLDNKILTRELKVRVSKEPLFSYLLQQNLAHFLNTCDPNSTPPGRGPVWSWGRM